VKHKKPQKKRFLTKAGILLERFDKPHGQHVWVCGDWEFEVRMAEGGSFVAAENGKTGKRDLFQNLTEAVEDKILGIK